MELTLMWFVDKILPWLTIAICGGAFQLYRKVDKLQNDLTVLTKDCHQLTSAIERKWQDVDIRVREDIKDLKEQVTYITQNHVSRDELNQYLLNLNSTVDRLSETLNKFL